MPERKRFFFPLIPSLTLGLVSMQYFLQIEKIGKMREGLFNYCRYSKNIFFVWSYYSIGKVQEGLLKSSSICIQCCSPQTETPPIRRMTWYEPYHVIPLVTWFLTLWDAVCLVSWDHDMGHDMGNDMPSFDGCPCPNCGVTYERVCRHQVNKCKL